MGFSFDCSGDVGVLTLNCNLTLENASRLREFLMVSLENADYVVVNFKNVTEAEASCLQMLCSAHRISMRSKKKLTVTGVSPEVMRYTADELNSFCASHCVPECGNRCLWMSEGLAKN
jgi:anti-anti-sigma regulatory factor